MIDLHIHIIPGVDDGSRDMETSLRMASLAYESGIHHIVTTSHCYPGLFENYADDEMNGRWEELVSRMETERIPIHFYKGMEIMGTDHTASDLKEGKVWTINETQYFLIEFEFDEKTEFCDRILKECREAGFLPLIAHPERYYFVQKDPSIVYRWVQLGYGIQVNKGSLLSGFGRREKETAESLLRHHLVHCTASDAHNISSRSPSMTRLRHYLQENYGNEHAYLLMEENPKRILSGRRLVGYEPLQYNKHSGRGK